MSEEPQVTGDQTDAAGPVDAAIAEHDAAHGDQESRQVPLDALQAERAERQRLQDELRMVKDNMQLMMTQMRQPQSQEKEDMNEDDVITYGDFKKALQKEKQQLNMTLEELRMTQQHPDYRQVVTKYLPDVLKQNPGLRNTLQSNNDYELAYYLAKNSDAYKADHKKAAKNADAERIIQNAQRSGSLSSVGQTSPINEARRYKDMSDDDFRKTVQKNLGYF